MHKMSTIWLAGESKVLATLYSQFQYCTFWLKKKTVLDSVRKKYKFIYWKQINCAKSVQIPSVFGQYLDRIQRFSLHISGFNPNTGKYQPENTDNEHFFRSN